MCRIDCGKSIEGGSWTGSGEDGESSCGAEGVEFTEAGDDSGSEDDGLCGPC